MKRIERVLLSMRGEIQLSDVGVWQETLCDIAKETVKCSSCAFCHIQKRGYTGRDACKQYCDHSMNTQEC